MACASHFRRDGGSRSGCTRACTKLTISCEEIVFDTPKNMKMGNNSVRFRFEWDIIGTVKLIIRPTSLFFHNLLSFLYKAGIGNFWATLGARRLQAAVREDKESGWEGLDALPSRSAGSSPSEAATRILSQPYSACGGALGAWGAPGSLGAPAGAPGAPGAPPAVGAPAAGASKGSPHCGHFSALTSSHT